MRLARCEKGHYYDKDKFSACPHCNGMQVAPGETVAFVDPNAQKEEEAQPQEEQEVVKVEVEDRVPFSKVTMDSDENYAEEISENDQEEPLDEMKTVMLDEETAKVKADSEEEKLEAERLEEERIEAERKKAEEEKQKEEAERKAAEEAEKKRKEEEEAKKKEEERLEAERLEKKRKEEEAERKAAEEAEKKRKEEEEAKKKEEERLEAERLEKERKEAEEAKRKEEEERKAAEEAEKKRKEAEEAKKKEELLEAEIEKIEEKAKEEAAAAFEAAKEEIKEELLDEQKTEEITPLEEIEPEEIFEKNDNPIIGWLICIEGLHKGKSFDVKEGRNFIGRSLKNDICLADNMKVSKNKDAILTYDPRGKVLYLQPEDTRGLIYINDKLLFGPDKVEHEDTIVMADETFIFLKLTCERADWL